MRLTSGLRRLAAAFSDMGKQLPVQSGSKLPHSRKNPRRNRGLEFDAIALSLVPPRRGSRDYFDRCSYLLNFQDGFHNLLIVTAGILIVA